MSIVRQLPQLYLRGSIANITMKSLTDEQKRIVSAVTDKVALHPALAPHRIKFCNQLGNTIGGDYNDDRFSNGKLRTSAEQEYLIVIWKATVILLYHQKYAYKCLACNEDKYTTQKNKVTPFDRQWDVCPNCKCVRIKDDGSYININDLNNLVDKPEYESPIEVTPLGIKYEDPDKVLNNDDELKRFYGEYIWGYFKQVLKENGIKSTKELRTVTGSIHEVIIAEICSAIDKYKVTHYYHKDNNPADGYQKIQVNVLAAPPELAIDIQSIASKYDKLGASILVYQKSIWVKTMSHTGVVQAGVVDNKPINQLGSSTQSGESEFSVLDTIDSGEDNYDNVDNGDRLFRIREYLPGDNVQTMFDIIINSGDAWLRFSEFCANNKLTTSNSRNYGPRTPKNAHLATFFGVKTKQIKEWADIIRIKMIEHNIIPDNCR